MRAIITREGAGLRVQLKDQGGKYEHFANGIVLHDGQLFLASDYSSTSSELATFRGHGRAIDVDDIADFMSTTLPMLERQVTVDRREVSLPSLSRIKPTVEWTTRETPRGLEVMPLLVYGEPPQARVDGDKLVQLSPNALPIRDRRAETELVRTLRREFDLAPGIREIWDPATAFKLTPKLKHARVQGDAHENYVLHGELAASIHQPSDDDIIGLQFRLDSPDGTSDTLGANDVMRKWNLGERYIKLPSGGFAKLPSSWLNRHGDKLTEVMAALNMAKGIVRLISRLSSRTSLKTLVKNNRRWLRLGSVQSKPRHHCRQRRRRALGYPAPLSAGRLSMVARTALNGDGNAARR